MAETHMCPACGMPKSAWKATNGQGYTDLRQQTAENERSNLAEAMEIR